MVLAIFGIFIFAVIWIVAFTGLADAVKMLLTRYRKPQKPETVTFRPYCLGPRLQG